MKTHPDLTLTILIEKLRHQTVAKQNLKIRRKCGCSAEGCNDQLSLTLFDRTPVLLSYMTPPPVARISPKLRVPGPSCPLLCRHVSRRGQSLQSGPARGGGGGGIWICYTEPPQRLMGQSGANNIKYVRACCVCVWIQGRGHFLKQHQRGLTTCLQSHTLMGQFTQNHILVNTNKVSTLRQF